MFSNKLGCFQASVFAAGFRRHRGRRAEPQVFDARLLMGPAHNSHHLKEQQML
jgi:hypothetical protein